jgi:hypothetical protein
MIKTGTDRVSMRVFNSGPGSVFVKEGKKLSVLLRAGNACDLSAGTSDIFVTANDNAASGWYDRL